MSAIDPTKYQLKYMEETILEALGYLLDIHSTIQRQKAEKEKQTLVKKEAEEVRRKESFYDTQTDICFLDGHPLLGSDLKYSLPIMHLIYMPE